jgi:sugar phosphate isomerase/epimerase
MKYYGLSPKDFKQALAANQLTSSSGHYELTKFIHPDSFDDDLKKYIDECIEGAHALGHEYIVWPWLDPESRSIDTFKRLAVKLNKIGEQLKPANLLVAYHNQGYEFEKQNGQYAYDILLKETDSSLVKMQMDMYWFSFSTDLKPHDFFVQYPGRFVSWHLKDMSKKDRNLHEVMGDGTVDFHSIFKDVKLSGVKHMFVEQGNNYTPDAMTNVAKSAKYVKDVLFKL